MAKITIADLKKIKEEYGANQALREGGFTVKVTVHMGTCGIAAGARVWVTSSSDIPTRAGSATSSGNGWRPTTLQAPSWSPSPPRLRFSPRLISIGI